jgi:hypothetical protein
MGAYHVQIVELSSPIKHVDRERSICYGNTLTLVTMWSRTQTHGLQLDAWQRLVAGLNIADLEHCILSSFQWSFKFSWFNTTRPVRLTRHGDPPRRLDLRLAPLRKPKQACRKKLIGACHHQQGCVPKHWSPRISAIGRTR